MRTKYLKTATHEAQYKETIGARLVPNPGLRMNLERASKQAYI